MTPSTPPRSRSTILLSHQLQSRQKLDGHNNSNSNNNDDNNTHSNSTLNDTIDDGDDDFFLSNISRKPHAPPETPKKNTGLDIPMTPSTILHRSYNITNSTNRVLFKYDKNNASYSNGNNNVLLAPPLSKYNGLRSPEFSPMRRLSIIPSDNDKNDNNITTEKEDIKLNKNNVTRVLFPISLSSDDDDDDGDEVDNNELFAPSTPPNKMAKNCPGTPSHQIITMKQAKNWNNESYPLYNEEHGKRGDRNNDYAIDSDDDNSDFICEAKLENPFMTSFSSSSSPSTISRPLSKQERLERHQQLIKENPDIENVITYVNKRGEITKRRVLTLKEKKRFKPRALIFKDDDSGGEE